MCLVQGSGRQHADSGATGVEKNKRNILHFVPRIAFTKKNKNALKQKKYIGHMLMFEVPLYIFFSFVKSFSLLF